MDRIYPVGSIYISTVATSPATLFGGTWTAINAGYYLRSITAGTTSNYIAATNVGNTTLTTAQIPAHSHSYISITSNSETLRHVHYLKDAARSNAEASGYGLTNSNSPGFANRVLIYKSGNNTIGMGYTNDHQHVVAGNTNNTGSNGAHTHTMGTPATLTVYMWKRTA